MRPTRHLPPLRFLCALLLLCGGLAGCHFQSLRDVLTGEGWTRRNIHGVPVQSEPDVDFDAIDEE